MLSQGNLSNSSVFWQKVKLLEIKTWFKPGSKKIQVWNNFKPGLENKSSNFALMNMTNTWIFESFQLSPEFEKFSILGKFEILRFLAQIWILEKFQIRPEFGQFSIFTKFENFDFWPKFGFLENSKFGQNSTNFRFLQSSKFSIFDPNLDFWKIPNSTRIRPIFDFGKIRNFK